jgi:hypothetical protein
MDAGVSASGSGPDRPQELCRSEGGSRSRSGPCAGQQQSTGGPVNPRQPGAGPAAARAVPNGVHISADTSARWRCAGGGSCQPGTGRCVSSLCEVPYGSSQMFDQEDPRDWPAETSRRLASEVKEDPWLGGTGQKDPLFCPDDRLQNNKDSIMFDKREHGILSGWVLIASCCLQVSASSCLLQFCQGFWALAKPHCCSASWPTSRGSRCDSSLLTVCL